MAFSLSTDHILAKYPNQVLPGLHGFRMIYALYILIFGILLLTRQSQTLMCFKYIDRNIVHYYYVYIFMKVEIHIYIYMDVSAQMVDYEDVTIPKTFPLTVTVTDGVDPPATASVSIVVLDVNDNAPVILPSTAAVQIMENILDVNIQQYTATDADTGAGGQFR